MKSELDKCLAGQVFNGSDPELLAMTVKAKRLTRQLNDTDFADEEARTAIMRQLFGSMGSHVHVDTDFHCEYGCHIRLGSNVIINMNCTFVDNNLITIGNNVLIASNVQIYTATHPVMLHERIEAERHPNFCNTYALPVTVCDGVWIGGGAILLPGVTIRAGSVVGAGSVVTRSIPPGCVAVGNPCRVIRRINTK